MSASQARHACRASATSSRSCSAARSIFLPDQAERLERPARAEGLRRIPRTRSAGRSADLPQGRVVPLRHQPGQRLPLAADRRPAAAARLGRAATLLAGRLEPGGERPLAYRVEPRDLGLATLASFVGGEHTLAQVGRVARGIARLRSGSKRPQPPTAAPGPWTVTQSALVDRQRVDTLPRRPRVVLTRPATAAAWSARSRRARLTTVWPSAIAASISRAHEPSVEQEPHPAEQAHEEGRS